MLKELSRAQTKLANDYMANNPTFDMEAGKRHEEFFIHGHKEITTFRDPCYKVNPINIVNIVSEFGYQLSLAILSLLQY